MNLGHPNCLSANAQARAEPLLIPLNRAAIETAKECNITNINMHQDPTSSTSKTYELKITTFKNDKPEEFLKMMKNFNTVIYGTRTTTAAGKIDCLRTLLRGEYLR